MVFANGFWKTLKKGASSKNLSQKICIHDRNTLMFFATCNNFHKNFHTLFRKIKKNSHFLETDSFNFFFILIKNFIKISLHCWKLNLMNLLFLILILKVFIFCMYIVQKYQKNNVLDYQSKLSKMKNFCESLFGRKVCIFCISNKKNCIKFFCIMKKKCKKISCTVKI